MKALFLTYVSVALLLTACNSNSESDTVKDFIPGTYIRSSQHEYGTENDTVVISLQNKSASEYKVERRWKYGRMLDGKPIEPEYKLTTTSAIYNKDSKLLQETETGDTYSFDTKEKSMFAGTTKYQKIK
ncbi:MAG: hypothetical protein IPL04_08545 [Chitinophagaceae bacterium]|nr:hypothetical protein [Chitinophagaceae bacterium]